MLGIETKLHPKRFRKLLGASGLLPAGADELAKGGLTGLEIKDKLSTTAKVAAALIKHGYLKTITVINPVNRCPTVVVPIEEVERFTVEYVSLFALAKQQGRHFLAVKKDLDAGGIKPALDAKKIGATFYRREVANRKTNNHT